MSFKRRLRKRQHFTFKIKHAVQHQIIYVLLYLRKRWKTWKYQPCYKHPLTIAYRHEEIIHHALIKIFTECLQHDSKTQVNIRHIEC
jgi:hypothetical protein